MSCTKNPRNHGSMYINTFMYTYIYVDIKIFPIYIHIYMCGSMQWFMLATIGPPLPASKYGPPAAPGPPPSPSYLGGLGGGLWWLTHDVGCINIHICIYKHGYMLLSISIHAYIHAYKCTYVYTCIYVYIYIHIHVLTYTYAETKYIY